MHACNDKIATVSIKVKVITQWLANVIVISYIYSKTSLGGTSVIRPPRYSDHLK